MSDLCWYSIPPRHSIEYIARVRRDHQQCFDFFHGATGVWANQIVEVCEVEKWLVLVQCHPLERWRLQLQIPQQEQKQDADENDNQQFQ
jgi:hypothetical protein